MSAFDTARDLRLPGLVIGQAHIDPSHLGVRMKKMVMTMIRKGVYEGGWSSKSRQLAHKLVEGTDIRMVAAHSRGFYAPKRHTYSDEVAEQVCKLIDADEAIELMSDAQGRAPKGYQESIMERAREKHREARDVIWGNVSGVHSRWCWVYSSEISKQITEIFASTRQPAEMEAAERLCDKLNNNELIPVQLTF